MWRSRRERDVADTQQLRAYIARARACVSAGEAVLRAGALDNFGGKLSLQKVIDWFNSLSLMD